MAVQWLCKKFDELTVHELYSILQLRIEVFVVEQNCPFQDADGKDHYCFHLMGWENELLAAYSRLAPAAVTFEEISIGRVVTSPKARNKGYGKYLMQSSIAACYRLFGRSTIRIGAQLYLKKFYESAGFQQAGAVYVEDGIDHIEMTLSCRCADVRMRGD